MLQRDSVSLACRLTSIHRLDPGVVVSVHAAAQFITSRVLLLLGPAGRLLLMRQSYFSYEQMCQGGGALTGKLGDEAEGRMASSQAIL
jgi:hypothetical protein